MCVFVHIPSVYTDKSTNNINIKFKKYNIEYENTQLQNYNCSVQVLQ